MTKIKGSTLLITGGASGIGRLMGRLALEKGAQCLVIWDINEEAIASTVEELTLKGKVVGYKVDISNIDSVERIYRTTRQECGPIDILINCAGVVLSNYTFDKITPVEIKRTMDINATAAMVVTSQLLSEMIERNSGHVCNIASAAGMISNPRMSVYAASKWAMIGWSDSVRIELKQMRSRVRFTTIAPYYINTGMFNGVRSRLFPILKPEPTARKILRSVERGRNFKGIPFGYHFIRFWQAILPTSIFDYIFGEVLGIFHTMDHFTGRKR